MERRNLPWDMIEEILSRVPAKSLSRFRSTSKGWNNLLKSGSFARKHLANAPKDESLSIMLTDSRVYLMRINLHGFHDNVASSAKVAAQFYLKDPLSNSSQVDIRHVFHCDGLLLCATKDKRLVVWNPCSGETKWIKPRDCYKESDYYAFGYDNRSSCKQYKILRVDHQWVLSQISTEYEIYDFTSDSWKDLGVTVVRCLPSRHGGMSMKGNTYWVAHDKTSGGGSYPFSLLCFDFSAERFQSVSLPPSFPPYSAALSAMVREEKLCLLGTNSRDLQIWVTTSPGSVMSWSRFLTVKAEPVGDFYRELSFLADKQNKALVYCQYYSKSKHNRILDIVGGNKHIKVDPRDGNYTVRPSNHLLLNYVPSLAQIANCKTCDL